MPVVGRMEFLVTMTTLVPDGTTDEAVAEIRGREAVRSREACRAGPPVAPMATSAAAGEWRTIGLFAAADDVELEGVLASMPFGSGAPIRWFALGPIPTTRHRPQRRRPRSS